MTGRLISLAAGVLPEFSPVEMATAAVASGWPAVGIWVDPALWTPSIAAEIRARTGDAGMTVLDVEVIWLQPGDEDPAHFRIIDAGAAIGARNALVVSSDPDRAATAAKLARLVDHAAGSNMRVSLEFAAFTTVGTLAEAVRILELTERPDAGLLVDPLHFARTGAQPGDLAAIDKRRFAYAQLCDAPATGPAVSDIPGIVHEALDLRMNVGDGGLPLGAMLDALGPDLALSIELRSQALRDAFPDPTDSAAGLLASTRRGLARLEQAE